MQMGIRRPGAWKPLHERSRGEVGVDAQPAELKRPHKESGHEQPAYGAKGGSANNIKRQSGLHAEDAGDQEEQEVANNRPQHHPEKHRNQAAGGEPVIGNGGPKREPQKDAGVSLGRGLVPWRPVCLGVRCGAGNVGRERAGWGCLLIAHRSSVRVLFGTQRPGGGEGLLPLANRAHRSVKRAADENACWQTGAKHARSIPGWQPLCQS